MEEKQEPKIKIGKVEYAKHVYTDSDDWKQEEYTKYKDWTDEASSNKSSYGNKSVATYEGFYIARYEAGWEDTETSKLLTSSNYIESWEKEKTKKNETAITDNKKPISRPNTFAWNFITQQNAKAVSENMYKDNNDVGVTSYLVDGTAWDTITNWIAKDGVDVTKTSITYGNYDNNGNNYTGWFAKHIVAYKSGLEDLANTWCCAKYFTNGNIELRSKIESHDCSKKEELDCFANLSDHYNHNHDYEARIEIPTGSDDRFKLKNIYDLAGNMWELTTEVGNHRDTDKIAGDGDSFCVSRGGSYCCSGNSRVLCCRTGATNISASSPSVTPDIGFRVVLYIK